MNKAMIGPLYQVMNLYRTMCHKECPDLQMSQNEMIILAFLIKDERLDTAKEISWVTGMSTSLCSRAIDSLSKREMILLSRDTQDRRNVHLTVNPEKEDVIQSIKNINVKFEQQLLNGISEEEKEIFIRVLEKMRVNIQKGREVKE